MRRKRQRFGWLPTLGSTSESGSIHENTLNGRAFTISVFANTGGGHSINTFVVPVTADQPLDSSAAAVTVGGNFIATGTDWFLERIVGKLFLGSRIGDEAEQRPNVVLVGAGFFVARANDADSGGGIDTPIGSASSAERNENYGPLNEDTVREPWLWRRTWVLGGTAQADNGLSFAPLTNMNYGSVLDGPHIDAKSVRRIRNDERLWFAVATASISGSAGQIGGTVNGYLDYRILGAPRKSQNRSAF